jgi:hypothetical protein
MLKIFKKYNFLFQGKFFVNFNLLKIRNVPFSYKNGDDKNPSGDESLFDEDEVAALNELLKNPRAKNLKSEDNKDKIPTFELDPGRDYFNLKQATQSNTRKAVSQKERVALKNEENPEKFKIAPLPQHNVDQLLDEIFSNKTNKDFISNLDQVQNYLESEEINVYENLAKEKNIYQHIEELDLLDDKDLSEIEEEIRKRKNSDLVLEKEVTEKKNENLDNRNKIINLNHKDNLTQEGYLNNKENKENEIHKQQHQQHLPLQAQKIIQENNQNTLHEQFIKSLQNLNQQTQNTLATDKSQNVQNVRPKTSNLKLDPQNQNQKNTNYVLNLNILETISYHSETSIGEFINLEQETESLNTVFKDISKQTFDLVKLKNGTNKFFKKNNLPEFLIKNFEIKSNAVTYNLKFFKKDLLTLDKRNIELMNAKIQNLNPSHVTMVSNSKRNPKTKEGYGCVIIFADRQHICTMIYNIGQVQSLETIDFFNLFFKIEMVELLQSFRNSTWISYNLVYGKKFDAESKLNKTTTKNIIISIICSYLEGKLSRFLKKNNSELKEEENKSKIKEKRKPRQIITPVNLTFDIPNIKFYHKQALLRKDFIGYFKMGPQLDVSEICYKL